MTDRRVGAVGGMPRRDFLRVLGAGGAGLAAGPGKRGGVEPGAVPAGPGVGPQGRASVRAAFLYPPTESLRKAGYYSWPGAGFDAEGHHRRYARRIEGIARKEGVDTRIEPEALHAPGSVARFVEEVKADPPDGLLLVPLKKSEWGSVIRIVDETKVPSIVYAALGVLLNPHINQLHRRGGTYLISSLENFDAIAWGLRMIAAARRMRESRILSIAGRDSGETTVQHLGTRVRRIPRARLADAFRSTGRTGEVRDLARAYLRGARRVVEPSEDDVVDAARAYFACKRLLESEGAHAIMIDCLGGIRERRFAPPCMAYLTLRDEGIPAGCQNDLSATLSLMLMEYLFDRPGFQQNAASETERNHYFGAHCTCPTRLHGRGAPPAAYVLRNHAESGWGVAPQVIWERGDAVTMAQYLPGQEAEMIIYSGRVAACHDTPPAGGCRTNVELEIDGVDDICDVKGMHQAIICGDRARQLRRFCQLFGIRVVT